MIEGDNLDQAHPEPWRNGIDLAERNLAAMWRNYREAGYRRLVYTNTVSVLEMPGLIAALGGHVHATGVLLVAGDDSVAERLAVRETGSGLHTHLVRSARAAEELASAAPPSVRRVATDGRTVVDIAHELVDITGWVVRA